jgi:hypothetical protein
MFIRTAFATLVFFFALIGALSPDSYQRMLLMASNVTIIAGGGGEIPTRCLDLFSHGPKPGLHYQFALAGSNNTQVKIGNSPPIPLQDALDRKLLAIDGADDGGFTKLKVTNLTTQPLQIVTSDLTVIAPDNTYPSEDIIDIFSALASRKSPELPFLDPNRLKNLSPSQLQREMRLAEGRRQMMDQFTIWGMREKQAQSSLSESERDKLRQASLSADAAAFYNALVKRSLQNRQDAALLLIRTETAAGPVHSLFSGSGAPVVSDPFGPIGELYSSALNSWKASVPDTPLTFAIASSGRIAPNKFDPTYLLLAAAAAGSGGGSGGVIVTNPALFPEPPSGWKAFSITDSAGNKLIGPPDPPTPSGAGSGGGTGGGGIALIVTEGKRGPYEYREKFSRGEAHAFARQEVVISTMGSTIHRVLTSTEAQTLDKNALIRQLELSVRSDLDDQLYRLYPAIQAAEKGGRPGAYLQTSVDDATGQIEMALHTFYGYVRVVFSK